MITEKEITEKYLKKKEEILNIIYSDMEEKIEYNSGLGFQNIYFSNGLGQTKFKFLNKIDWLNIKYYFEEKGFYCIFEESGVERGINILYSLEIFWVMKRKI